MPRWREAGRGAFHAVADSNLGICRAGRVRRWGGGVGRRAVSDLSALSLSRGLLPQGRLVLPDAALRGAQALLLPQALFHDGAGAQPLPLHAAYLPRL